jgi:hypothetical protein
MEDEIGQKRLQARRIESFQRCTSVLDLKIAQESDFQNMACFERAGFHLFEFVALISPLAAPRVPRRPSPGADRRNDESRVSRPRPFE